MCEGERKGLPCIHAKENHPPAHEDTEGHKWIDYLHVRIGQGKKR